MDPPPSSLVTLSVREAALGQSPAPPTDLALRRAKGSQTGTGSVPLAPRSESAPAPEAGFARREAHKTQETFAEPSAHDGSANGRTTTPTRKEGVRGGTRGSPRPKRVAGIEPA